jgi:tRNA 2-thiouridine synthesizing protein A
MAEAIEIDARGLLCPLPVLRLRKALMALPSGTLVTLLADDPMAAIDVPHFCGEAGHAFLGGADGAYRVRRG